MAHLPKKLNFLYYNPENPFTDQISGFDKYNSYQMLTYAPLTNSQPLAVAAFSEPSRLVGGDFYEVFQKTPEKVGVIIADACGKGLGAAKMILHIQSLLKFELENGNSIEQTLENINDNLEDYISNGKFVTLFFGVLNINTRELLYANAGHDLPLILHQDNSYERLDSTGPGLGIIPGANFDIDKRYLDPNDMLFFYTDGVTDVFNDYSEIYGEKRMLDCLSKHRWYPPESIIDALIRDIESFSSSDTVPDDRTMIIMKIL
jgi:sigma-B regulation protein RsbU (phosphoserine phosphatase)